MSTVNNFSHLSIVDLIEARDMFHVHLMSKKNVIATAIGRYLLRKSDFNENGVYTPGKTKEPRTLQNSFVFDISWPCVLVFVNKWEDEQSLINNGSSDIIPKTIYMPDGRTVPICVVQSPTETPANTTIDLNQLRFPNNLIGGGFPVYVKSQGETHVASIGCVVSDGHTYYALTNKHVSGEAGESIYSILGKEEKEIGKSSGKSLNKVKFGELYPGWKGDNLLVCCDAGLVRIEDIKNWKTDIVDIPQLDELYDINTYNFTLGLIAEHKIENNKVIASQNGKVIGYGAVSGLMHGEIGALFYRYKSIGGLEYVSDFMITGRNGESLNTAHGNSGTVFMLETNVAENQTKYQPIALHWGQHEFFNGGKKQTYNFSLSTCLSNICRELDVEVVRGWNTDTDYSWGKTGHYKIAAMACEIVTTPKLSKLLKANKDNISFEDSDMKSGGLLSAKWGQFVPLADVPDIIWRMTRKADEANHFADMDESNAAVNGGKSLIELCKDPKNIDIGVWNKYYADMEALDATKSPNKRGALPFRVWQAYKLMVEALKAGNVEEFIMIGGTVSHYLGDACQPLHVSYLHHGHPGKPDEEKVHSVYETNMLDKYMNELLDGVNNELGKSHIYTTYTGGKEAAQAVINLMSNVISTILQPEEIISVYNETNKDRIGNMWKKLGDRTIQCVAAGSINLALFWESAWKEGNGNAITDAKLVRIDQQILMDLYNDKSKFPSYKLIDPQFELAIK